MLPPALADPDKIALMRRTSTTLSREIVIWMIWTKTSGWWKSYSFLLLPLPSLPAVTLINERIVTRATWRVPRWPLHQPHIPTVISPLRILSTSHSYSSCSSNKLRILSRLLLQSLVSSESQPNNLPSRKHHNITTTHISNLARMMSTNMGVDTRDLLWSLHSMDRFRVCLFQWVADCELGR